MFILFTANEYNSEIEGDESMKFLKKFQYNSPIILTFALISLVSLLLGYITHNRSTQLIFCVYPSSLLNPLTYIRAFTHVLGHADLSHYASNMMMLLLLGPILEEKYGSKLMVGMIVITALVTGIINNIFFSTALLGASGIVFMMIILASMASAQQGRIPLTFIVILIIYLGQEVVAGFSIKDNVSQLTHIIGGLCGAVFGRLYIRKGK